jgi:hypothetical protein
MKRLAVLFLVMVGATWTVASAGDEVTRRERSRSLSQTISQSSTKVAVYAHAHLLDSGDRLQDGPEGAEIHLDGRTLLIWVDKKPQYRFAHPTAYILVSGAGVKVVDGQWWPVLNGRRILYGKINEATIVSPYSIPTGDSDFILAHIYPEELESEDVLVDLEDVIDVASRSTFFMWVDMMPACFFAHPTVYILVTADNRIIVREGQWWPTLNGKKVLFGSNATFGVGFPFLLR